MHLISKSQIYYSRVSPVSRKAGWDGAKTPDIPIDRE